MTTTSPPPFFLICVLHFTEALGKGLKVDAAVAEAKTLVQELLLAGPPKQREIMDGIMSKGFTVQKDYMNRISNKVPKEQYELTLKLMTMDFDVEMKIKNVLMNPSVVSFMNTIKMTLEGN